MGTGSAAVVNISALISPRRAENRHGPIGDAITRLRDRWFVRWRPGSTHRCAGADLHTCAGCFSRNQIIAAVIVRQVVLTGSQKCACSVVPDEENIGFDFHRANYQQSGVCCARVGATQPFHMHACIPCAHNYPPTQTHTHKAILLELYLKGRE